MAEEPFCVVRRPARSAGLCVLRLLVFEPAL